MQTLKVAEDRRLANFLTDSKRNEIVAKFDWAVDTGVARYNTSTKRLTR
jgi:hypothetical protein